MYIFQLSLYLHIKSYIHIYKNRSIMYSRWIKLLASTGDHWIEALPGVVPSGGMRLQVICEEEVACLVRPGWHGSGTPRCKSLATSQVLYPLVSGDSYKFTLRNLAPTQLVTWKVNNLRSLLHENIGTACGRDFWDDILFQHVSTIFNGLVWYTTHFAIPTSNPSEKLFWMKFGKSMISLFLQKSLY